MMEAPLRAFFMMRSGDGTWEVTVCRDLAAIVRTWEKRKEPDRDTALLHVGFDHPPAVSFDAIAEAHAGRVLLTSAAKHVLPDSFVVSSAPVGATESAEVFAGLLGWGYRLDDPTAGAASLEPALPSAAAHEPQGWVSSFLDENPSDAEILSAHGIFDEASYIHREAELERNVRHRVGLFRTRYASGANCQDPCRLASAAPPWLAERELASLNLSARAGNTLRINGIKSVGDLANWSSEALLRLRPFGRKSLADTQRALTTHLNLGPLRSARPKAVSRPGQPEPRGWVASFLSKSPADAGILSSHGVVDEVTYIDREAELERNVRHRAGLFRARFIAGANCKDPCRLASAAPPWLVERELVSLKLSKRACSVFRAGGIETVGDLAAWSSAALLNHRNFGYKSLTDVLQALETALGDGPLQPATAQAIHESGRLLTEIQRSMLSLTDREREIVIRRLGFGTSRQTFQEIAEDYGLTKQRVQQIEAKATRRWIRDSSWVGVLEQKISGLVKERDLPLPVADVEASDPWFDGVRTHDVFFRTLVRNTCGDRIHTLRIDGLHFFSLVTQKTWERSVSDASALLSDGAEHQWSEDYARTLVHGLLPDTAKEFRTLLWDKVSRNCRFNTGNDGSLILASYGSGADQIVKAILAEAPSPLHFTEIAERTKAIGGRILDEQQAHRAAANVGYIFGPGTYGLERHVPLSHLHMSRIRGDAEDILCSERPGRQWHTHEILGELLERMHGGWENLDKYVLEIALSGSSKLRPLGRMTWVVAAEETDDQTRIDVRQTIVAIVKAAGRPLSASEIKERLTAVRGVSEYFQITPFKPLICVEAGIWGIEGRDVPLSRDGEC